MNAIYSSCAARIESNSRSYCAPPSDCITDTSLVGCFSFTAIFYGVAFTNPWCIAAGSIVCPAQTVVNFFTCQDRIFLRNRVESLELEARQAKSEIERLTAENRALNAATGTQIVFQQTMDGLPASHSNLQAAAVGSGFSHARVPSEDGVTFEELSARERGLIDRIDRLNAALTRMTRHRDLCVRTAVRLDSEKSALVESITKVIEQADLLQQFPECRERSVRVVVDAKNACIQRLVNEIDELERLITA
jgi:hypothetical protein